MVRIVAVITIISQHKHVALRNFLSSEQSSKSIKLHNLT
jgi:hypothetical protein